MNITGVLILLTLTISHRCWGEDNFIIPAFLTSQSTINSHRVGLEQVKPIVVINPIPVDIVIVFDGSSDVKASDFFCAADAASGFLSSLNNLNPLSKNLTRVGIIVYGTSQDIYLKITRFSNIQLAQEVLINVTIPKNRKNNRYPALNLGRRLLTRGSGRKSVKILLMFMGGPSPDSKSTIKLAKIMWNSGMTLYVAPISSTFDPTEALQIVNGIVQNILNLTCD